MLRCISKNDVTVQQVCAFTALTVRKHRLAGKNPIAAGNFSWIFACDCEGTEQLQNDNTISGIYVWEVRYYGERSET